MTPVTAVQLRERRPSARLLYGAPLYVTEGAYGHVARFAPGALVAYQIESSCRDSLFVFRTLAVSDRLAATVSGVRPRVQLLLELHAGESIRRMRLFFADLLARGESPDLLSDGFWGRLGTALRGRMLQTATLESLRRLDRQPDTNPARALP